MPAIATALSAGVPAASARPVPIGFDSTSTSPGRAPPLRKTRSGWTTPCTASPKIGSGLRIVCPPATEPPASATTVGGGLEDRRDRLAREVLGEGGDVDRHHDPPAHREHVAAGVGGGDRTEVGRMVDERREEVGGRHDRDVVAHAVDGGVVERGEADEQRRVGRHREVGDEILEQRRTPLRGTSTARRPLGQSQVVERIVVVAAIGRLVTVTGWPHYGASERMSDLS